MSKINYQSNGSSHEPIKPAYHRLEIVLKGWPGSINLEQIHRQTDLTTC